MKAFLLPVSLVPLIPSQKILLQTGGWGQYRPSSSTCVCNVVNNVHCIYYHRSYACPFNHRRIPFLLKVEKWNYFYLKYYASNISWAKKKQITVFHFWYKCPCHTAIQLLKQCLTLLWWNWQRISFLFQWAVDQKEGKLRTCVKA